MDKRGHQVDVTMAEAQNVGQMRDLNIEIKIGWECTKCGKRNVYCMQRIGVRPEMNSTYRPICYRCKKQGILLDLRILEE